MTRAPRERDAASRHIVTDVTISGHGVRRPSGAGPRPGRTASVAKALGRLAGVACIVAAAVPRTAWAADPSPPCAPPGDPADVRRVAVPGVAVAWRPVPAPIAVGRPFSIELVVCADGDAVPGRPSVDAWMPAHRHGMNYRPSIAGTPPGPVRADGLLFHMPGSWQMVFELQAGGRRLRLVDDLVVR